MTGRRAAAAAMGVVALLGATASDCDLRRNPAPAATGEVQPPPPPLPQDAISKSVSLDFVAGSSTGEAQVKIKTGRVVRVGPKDVRMPFRRTVWVPMHLEADFTVHVFGQDETAYCAITNTGSDEPIDEDTAAGDDPMAKCFLAALTERIQG